MGDKEGALGNQGVRCDRRSITTIFFRLFHLASKSLSFSGVLSALDKHGNKARKMMGEHGSRKEAEWDVMDAGERGK